MDGNGQDTPGVIMLPADPTQAETVIQTARDAVRQPFAPMDKAHSQYYASDMEQLAGIEAKALGEIALVKQKTQPAFLQAEVQKVADEALKQLDHYENNRVARLEAEVGRLKAQAPKRREVSEIEAHRQTSLTLYCLEQLQGSRLQIDRDSTAQVDLNDRAHFSLLFETELSHGRAPAVNALLNDPMERHLQYLTPEQRARGEALLGLAASPELKAKIDAYETMISRYNSRMAGMKRRFQEQGWRPPDALAEMARGERR